MFVLTDPLWVSVWGGANTLAQALQDARRERFLGQRYGDRSNLIWSPGGDKAPSTPEAVAIWRAMARGIAEGGSGREDYSKVLMTYHSAGPGHVSDYLHDEPWLDFPSAQSSHGDLVESWRSIESRPFLSHASDQTLIAGYVGEGADHMRALRGDGYALVYRPVGKPFRVHLDRLTGREVKAWWFDPRTGQATPAS